MFTMGTQPTSPIAPGGSQPFTITFTPTSTGLQTATVTIANNDLNENPYTFTLTGTGTAPEIDVKQGTTPIASGGSYGYGNVLVGSGGKAVSFTVENNGDGDLNLTGSPKVSLDGIGDVHHGSRSPPRRFCLGAASRSPSPSPRRAPGLQTATVTIANNDLNESSYTFTLTGTGTAPEIDLKQGTTPIASGGSYNYGSRAGGFWRHAGDLHHREQRRRGPEPHGHPEGVARRARRCSRWARSPPRRFSLRAASRSPSPSPRRAPGLQTATVTIANNDLNEGSYTFTLTGTGTAPEIDLKQGTTPIASGGSYNFGNRLVGSGGTPVDLHDREHRRRGPEPHGYPEGVADGLGDVHDGHAAHLADSPGGSQPFTITFTPTSTGLQTATVTIANNDSQREPATPSR